MAALLAVGTLATTVPLTTASATTVYRCGNTYQSTPCVDAASSSVDVRDERTAEQQRDAASRQADLQQMADTSRKSAKRGAATKRKTGAARQGVSGIPVRGGALEDTPLGTAEKARTKRTSTSLLPSRIVYSPQRDEKASR